MGSKTKKNRPAPRRMAPSRSAAKAATRSAKRIAPKDPGIAALISVAGMVLLAAPALGYFYLGQIRKGIIYLLASWGLAILALIAIFTLTSVLTLMGLSLLAVCTLPVGLAFGLILLCFNLLIIYDVYLTASHRPPKLPSF